ncbi:IS481-like element ISMyma5 family transposase [Mycobacterium marinum]|uniref:IS481-like element ISMyma5 family transposase n=1 Tax=Mycobacterium marinum TaxID=1781 RepID=UPI003561DAD4
MLQELRMSEMRYRAVLVVLDGAPVTAVARRFGVSRQTVHAWLRRYAEEGAALNLEDRSSRPHRCPHQMPVEVEARVLTLRDAHPRWGPTRIVYELQRDVVPVVPGRSSVYRVLVRNGRIDPAKRRRRRSDYKRWERGRPMELWQMDVVGGLHLRDGVEVKVVTGIDDNSRFVVSAKVVARATARPVCAALLEALRRHGVPEQILTDNGKVFTGRFGPGGSSAEVLFDRVCVENGIGHLLTAPRSATTTGKVERLHKTMRAEIFAEVDGVFDAIAELQAAIDRWVQYYNTARPHQSLGMVAPAARFALAAGPDLSVVEPVAAVPAEGQHPGALVDLRDAGVRRWVNRHGSISVAGFRYRVPIVLAGEPVSVVVADNLVSIYHHDVLVASHVQHRKTDNTTGVVRQGRRTARPVTSGIVVTRVVDSNGDVSFAGTMYRAGRVWRGKQVEVSIVAESVQIACAGAIVRTHAIRHDRAKEHGAFATAHGRPRKPRQDAPDGPGVKATPLRGRPDGRALTPAP